jgi:acetylornithine deacetylase
MSTQNDIDKLTEDAVLFLKRLIATPSFSREEQGTAALIQQFFQSRSLVASRLMNNIWLRNRHFDKKKPTLLLNSHHDTVKPNKQYTLNPFQPTEQDGKLFGLGSNDAGGCLVSLAAAFLHYYERRDMKYNLVFAATAEEEISGSNGIEALLPSLGKIDCGIVGEPTGMNMAVAEKGLMVVDCTIAGKAGHAAREEGENAIYKSLDYIRWFDTYKFPEVSELLGAVKMSVTMVQAGTQHNVVPDSCKFTADIRLNERYTHEQVLAVIREHINGEVVPRSTRLRSSFIAADHPLVKAGTELGLTSFGSVTMSDKALMPFPALKMGPGDSARSHTADEYIHLEEIDGGIRTYIKLLDAVLL